jgi:rare lipoprotein A
MLLGGVATAQAQPAARSAMVSDTPVLLGEPYAVGGVSYRPVDPPSYDEVGTAVVGGGASRSDTTANGEVFVPDGITAAHKTLPLPSYVEVTALDSGRTILVRVNDRGPMRGDRLIGLSPGAAAQLGVADGAPVRVRRVNPPEQERAVLRAHGRAAERLETPPALLKVLRTKLGTAVTAAAAARPSLPPAKPIPVPSRARPGADFDAPAAATARAKPPLPPAGKAADARPVDAKPVAPRAATAPASAKATPPVTGGYVVQVGAFASRTRAEALAKSIGARAEAAGTLWRVRLGPYGSRQAAQAGVRAAAAKGFENAPILANDGR